MTESQAARVLLIALGVSSVGCGYVRDARLCVKAGEAIALVSNRPEKVESDPNALAREAAQWGTLKDNLDQVASGAPKALAQTFRALGKEAGLARDALTRARQAVLDQNSGSYQAQSRSLDATRRRLDNSLRDVKRACGAQ